LEGKDNPIAAFKRKTIIKNILGIPFGPGYTLQVRHKATTQIFTGLSTSIPNALKRE
jgi:hypothetical protein